MATTTATGLPIPTSGDAPDLPAIVGTNLGGALDKVTVPLFASTSARDTAYASVPFGLCFVGASVDAGTLYRRRGGSWHEVQDVDSLIGPYTTSGICTAGTGWTVNTQIGQRMGPFMYIVTACTYSGSTITATSKGVVSGSNIMFTLTTAWNNKNIGRFPGFTCQGNFAASYPYAAWAAQAKSNGDVVIVSGAPTFTIVSGDVIVTTGMYLAAA